MKKIRQEKRKRVTEIETGKRRRKRNHGIPYALSGECVLKQPYKNNTVCFPSAGCLAIMITSHCSCQLMKFSVQREREREQKMQHTYSISLSISPCLSVAVSFHLCLSQLSSLWICLTGLTGKQSTVYTGRHTKASRQITARDICEWWMPK